MKRSSASLVLVLAVIPAFVGCSVGNKVTVTWAVRGPVGARVAIQTSPGGWKKYTMPKSGTGVSGKASVAPGKDVKVWADLSSGEMLTCVLADRTGLAAQDAGHGHCEAKLRTRR